MMIGVAHVIGMKPTLRSFFSGAPVSANTSVAVLIGKNCDSAASAVDAVRSSPGRTLFLCWPPYDDDDASYAALRAYRGDALVYVGGGADGPTGTVRFHQELALNWRPAEQVLLPNWPGLRDRLVVYRRNRARLPLAARDRCADCRDRKSVV